MSQASDYLLRERDMYRVESKFPEFITYIYIPYPQEVNSTIQRSLANANYYYVNLMHEWEPPGIQQVKVTGNGHSWLLDIH